MTQRANYISFRVGPKLYASVKERAEAEEKSVSEWARQALEAALSAGAHRAYNADGMEIKVTQSP